MQLAHLSYVRQVGVNKLLTEFDRKKKVRGCGAVDNKERRALVPYFEKAIPRSSSDGHTVFRYTQTTDTVIVTS